MSFRNDDDFDSSTYVRVNTRLMEFHKEHPKGRVETSYVLQDGVLVMRAALYRDEKDTLPAATGHAFLESLTGEKVGEYTETVAVGRALALMGYSIEKSLASGEEMARFKDRQDTKKPEKVETKSPPRSRSSYSSANRAEQKDEQQALAKSEPAKSSATPEVVVEGTTMKVESKPSVTAQAATEIKDTPTEVRKLTTSRIFKPLPKAEQQQTGGK